MGTQARNLQVDGVHWMRHRQGIVVYINQSQKEGSSNRIHVIPRNVTIELVPGMYAPPPSFTLHGEKGHWEPYDWIRMPVKLEGDPVTGCVLYLRRIFYRLQIGHRTGRWRAYDCWPQPGQPQPIWPWEPARFKRKGN
jgi:hypothetical protein